MEKEITKNRQATEMTLITAVNDIIEESGFEGLGINAVAAKAKVSKMLIYRYFNSLDGLTAFGSVHPESPDALDELERIKAAGLKGIKLHPDYQHFFVEEKRLFPIYEKAAELGLITVFHAGVDIGLPDPVHCTPQALANILPVFQGAPVVAAHFGGYMMRAETMKHLIGQDICFDTSYSHSRFPPPWAKEIIKAHGAKKILLGSDMPWSRTDYEINYVKSLGLDDVELALVLGGNAQRLLNI